jgi:RNA polymerase-binding transcription factor DksA
MMEGWTHDSLREARSRVIMERAELSLAYDAAERRHARYPNEWDRTVMERTMRLIRKADLTLRALRTAVVEVQI